MTEPNGYEYTLEATQQRTTSIIMRKSPNLCTLVQTTPAGRSVIELSDGAKAALIGLLGAPVITATPAQEQQIIEMHLAHLGEARGVIVEPPKNKGGRPRKHPTT